jgi:hypothetical protein
MKGGERCLMCLPYDDNQRSIAGDFIPTMPMLGTKSAECNERLANFLTIGLRDTQVRVVFQRRFIDHR